MQVVGSRQMDRFQVHGTLTVASTAIAYFVAGSLSARFVLTFVITITLLEWIWHMSMKKATAAIQRRDAKFSREMLSTDMEEARRDALRLVELSAKKSRRHSPLPHDLPPSVREVFSDFEAITSNVGEVLRIGPVHDGFVEVGETFYGAKVRVRLSDGRLFEMDDEGPNAPKAGLEYLSLYHWIVARFSEGSVNDS